MSHSSLVPGLLAARRRLQCQTGCDVTRDARERHRTTRSRAVPESARAARRPRVSSFPPAPRPETDSPRPPSRRPRPEIVDYAKWLGMDMEVDKHLLWVARQGLKAPLPKDWKPCKSPEGEIYYFNFSTGESVWDHPCDDHYRNMYQEEKKKNPKPAPENKDKDKKKRPKKSGSSGSSSAGGSAGGTELKAVVAPKDRSNLASAADLLGPVSVGGSRGGCGRREEGGGRAGGEEDSGRQARRAGARGCSGACGCSGARGCSGCSGCGWA